MFDLLDKPLHWIAVKWPSLVAPKNKGKLSEPGESEIEIRVEFIDREEAIWRFPALFAENDDDEWLTRLRKERGPSPKTAETFKHIVKDWRKIKANGQAVPLNDENIGLLLNVPMFEAAFALAYVKALGGQAEVREGNSSGSPSGGRADTGKPATTNSNETATDSA